MALHRQVRGLTQQMKRYCAAAGKSRNKRRWQTPPSTAERKGASVDGRRRSGGCGGICRHRRKEEK
eukprot:398446-Pleurochrysis_carterae.AAC.1